MKVSLFTSQFYCWLGFYIDFQVGNYFLKTLKASFHCYVPFGVPAILIPDLFEGNLYFLSLKKLFSLVFENFMFLRLDLFPDIFAVYSVEVKSYYFLPFVFSDLSF